MSAVGPGRGGQLHILLGVSDVFGWSSLYQGDAVLTRPLTP